MKTRVNWEFPTVMFEKVFVGMICTLLFFSCASTVSIDDGEIPRPLTGEIARFASAGAYTSNVRNGVIKGEFGCRTEYETYASVGKNKTVESSVHVFIGHGFMRDLRSMRGWAELFSSHGIDATVVSFCNSTIINGHHDRNAQDLIAVAAQIHEGPVVYAGFSAGGLSAYIAASRDERAVACLGLDSVDSGGLAGAVNAETLPSTLLLFGEPSSCNAKNNFLSSIPDSDRVTAIRVINATHCHFENPYGKECESVCGAVAPKSAADRIIETIKAVSVAWIVSLSSDPASKAAPTGSLPYATRAGAAQWSKRITVLQYGDIDVPRL